MAHADTLRLRPVGGDGVASVAKPRKRVIDLTRHETPSSEIIHGAVARTLRWAGKSTVKKCEHDQASIPRAPQGVAGNAP